MGDAQRLTPAEQLRTAREQFESGPDLSVAVEEEFAILDPDSLGLANRFEELQDAVRGTELEPHLVGELIASEVEVRTGRCDSFAEAVSLIGERRAQLRALAE
ncbi:MAG TPA: glutamate-cysteine ligase family protein, partial [Gaiellaceae bacterium]